MVSSSGTFLYPTSKKFPFDGTCEEIVRALEARQWRVPGITVEFDNYGGYRLVRYIRGDDFRLWFCRVQARMGQWNDTAAVSEITIPRREIYVFADESDLIFYTYVGRSWERDKDAFFNHHKCDSKLKGEPRTYLLYKGACQCGAASGATHTHPGRRPPLLVHDNDLGREYDPQGSEPRMFRTADVFAEFDHWLRNELLARILAQPLPQ